MSCKNYKKTVDPKCNTIDGCQWIVGKGCMSKDEPRADEPKVNEPKLAKKNIEIKSSDCKKYKKTVSPKCGDQSSCRWIVGKGCMSMDEPLPLTKPKMEKILENIQVNDISEIHDLTPAEIDLLLKAIKVETKSKVVLMDIVNEQIDERGISGKDAIYKLKVQVLFDNLAQKMCRCVEKIKNDSVGIKTAICRKGIFQKRGIDFYTYECEPVARLNPKKDSKMILHKYVPKQKPVKKSTSPKAGGGLFGRKKKEVVQREFYIHDNGGKPFLVYLEDNNEISVFKARRDTIDEDDIMYEEQILNIPYEQIWIPEGYNTDHMGKKVKGTDYLYIDSKLGGNTILVKIDKNKYVYIGKEIYSFSLNKDDQVVAYYSLVGPNDVPYPVIVSRQGVYFMLDKKFIKMEYFRGIVNELEFIDAYSYYYGHKGDKKLEPYGVDMKNVKVIQSRHFY